VWRRQATDHSDEVAAGVGGRGGPGCGYGGRQPLTFRWPWSKRPRFRQTAPTFSHSIRTASSAFPPSWLWALMRPASPVSSPVPPPPLTVALAAYCHAASGGLRFGFPWLDRASHLWFPLPERPILLWVLRPVGLAIVPPAGGGGVGGWGGATVGCSVRDAVDPKHGTDSHICANDTPAVPVWGRNHYPPLSRL
jgi:hypothetical protein